jgi:hypothetical protein
LPLWPFAWVIAHAMGLHEKYGQIMTDTKKTAKIDTHAKP